MPEPHGGILHPPRFSSPRTTVLSRSFRTATTVTQG